MILLANIQLAHPWFLLLLLLIPIAAYWYWTQRQTYHPNMRISSMQGLESIRSWRVRLRPLLPILRALAFAVLIIAMARPQEALTEENIKAEGIDIMLVMDLSSSMLAKDFEPDRLEVSKLVAASFVDKRRFDRIGLAVFAGESYTQCPLTTDHRVLKEYLSALKCGLLDDGTAIGEGLAVGVNRLEKDGKAKSKVLILLTDGENNSGYVKPLTAADIAKEFDVKVYTIGVGTIGDALTPVSRRSDGKYVFGRAKVRIDEDLLKNIAEMTGGRYFRATSEEALTEIYAEIDRLEKTEMDITVVKRKSEHFFPFVLAGMILLLLELLLRYTLFRTVT